MASSSSTSCPDLVESLTSSLEIGSKFSSFDDLKCFIATYEKERSVQLLQRDSRTLEAARKRYLLKLKKQTRALCTALLLSVVRLVGKTINAKVKAKEFTRGLSLY